MINWSDTTPLENVMKLGMCQPSFNPVEIPHVLTVCLGRYLGMTVKGWVWYQGENDMSGVFGSSIAKVVHKLSVIKPPLF
jgi:hypothetical protein